jgi:hypothetical protein
MRLDGAKADQKKCADEYRKFQAGFHMGSGIVESSGKSLRSEGYETQR